MVHDASSLLAVAFREPGAEVARGALRGSFVSSVNGSEVVQKVAARQGDATVLRQLFGGLGVTIISFSAEHAERAATLCAETRVRGLSLGDRACSALGLERPDGKGVWLGWLSNWQYASDVPTYPWRSAQSVPRTLHLEPRGGELRLVQQPVESLRVLRGERVAVRDQRLRPGEAYRPATEGETLEVVATFELGDAAEVGLRVRVGAGERTVVGYDAGAAELFVDRRRSGRADFSGDFAGVHRGPLAAPGGRVTIHALVDTSSVEVFGGGGQTVITDLIFPDRASRGLEVYAKGGAARLVSLDVWPLRSIWALD